MPTPSRLSFRVALLLATAPLPAPAQSPVSAATGRIAYDAEVGLGVRANAGTIIKASYRRSWWHGAALRDGYALALQVSYHVDVMDLFERKR